MSIREEQDGPLGAVLRAAAAPAHPAELAGEEAAAAAFMAATPAPRRRSFLARVLTVKALVIGGVAASTGVVLATASGVLPAPWPERPSGPPADPPAVTTTVVNTASVPAVTPPAGRPPAEGEPADEDTGLPQVQPPGTSSQPCEPQCAEHGAEDGRGDKPGKGDKPDKNKDPEPPTSLPTSPPTEPSREPRSPVSPAPGAVTAVPPSGATPPTEGD